MNTTRLVAVVLIVIGVISLAYQGLSYTRTEKVVDLGPIEINATTRERIPLPPILGGLALAGGILLLVSARKA